MRADAERAAARGGFKDRGIGDESRLRWQKAVTTTMAEEGEEPEGERRKRRWRRRWRRARGGVG